MVWRLAVWLWLAGRMKLSVAGQAGWPGLMGKQLLDISMGPPGILPQRMMREGAKDEGGDEGEEDRASSSVAILGQAPRGSTALALEGDRPCSLPRDVHFGPSWRRNARYLRP